jgi:hypothetical protein
VAETALLKVQYIEAAEPSFIPACCCIQKAVFCCAVVFIFNPFCSLPQCDLRSAAYMKLATVAPVLRILLA